MKSEEGYNKIITDLESQDSKKKNEKARKSRFAWLWGNRDNKEDKKRDDNNKVRIRSKSETGIETLPSLSVENKPEINISKVKSKRSNVEKIVPPKQDGESLFTRFLKLFRSSHKNTNEAILLDDELTDKKKLQSFEQIDPKSGDTGVDSNEGKEPAVSLDDFMKEFMEFVEHENGNAGVSRTLKEHHNWMNEKAQYDEVEKAQFDEVEKRDIDSFK